MWEPVPLDSTGYDRCEILQAVADRRTWVEDHEVMFSYDDDDQFVGICTDEIIDLNIDGLVRRIAGGYLITTAGRAYLEAQGGDR